MAPDPELVIEARLLLPQGLTDGCVGVSRGRIVAIRKILEGDDHREMSGCVVVPAAVDMHVHFRDPGLTKKGDFTSESRAAAFGGVTTVADMPNTKPPAVTEPAWRGKLEAIEGRSFVDYALYMGLSEGALVARLGRSTGLFKLYTASTTGDLLVGDARSWSPLLATVAEAGGRVVVHAEDQSTIERARPTQGGLHGHDEARPPAGEAAAVRQACLAAASTGAPGRVHIAHVSCRQALEALEGSGTSAEVTPHHIFLDRRMEDLGAFGKVNPPLRTDADRAALWEALADGRVPVLASDHAPHTREEKQLGFGSAPAGIPGVETMVPLAMAQVRHGRIALERLVDACATRPAAFLGIAPRVVEEGAPAHLAVYDLHEEEEVTADMLHHRCGWTPYEGMTAVFPRLVLGPGGVLVDDGEFQQGRPQGRYVGLDLEGLRSV